jgi:hypothetical protein
VLVADDAALGGACSDGADAAPNGLLRMERDPECCWLAAADADEGEAAAYELGWW